MTNQELFTLIKKNPISFGCGVLSLALAAAIYFRSDAIPEAEADLTQKSAQAERLALNIQHSSQLKEQLEAVTTANKEIEERMLHASQLSINTQYFYKLESATGVKMVELRQNTPPVVGKPSKGSFVPIAFSVTVQGTPAQVLGFLREVEGGAHYSRVLSASCNAGGGPRGSSMVLGLNLELLGLP